MDQKKQPAPILLSVEEFRNAGDAFAIEFLDIRAAYRVLYGEDLAMQRDRKALRSLLTDSRPSFSTLFRHGLILDGRRAAVKKREVFLLAAEAFGISTEPFETILALRQESKRITDAEARPLFIAYLEEITEIASHVDRIDKEATRAEG